MASSKAGLMMGAGDASALAAGAGGGMAGLGGFSALAGGAAGSAVFLGGGVPGMGAHGALGAEPVPVLDEGAVTSFLQTYVTDECGPATLLPYDVRRALEMLYILDRGMWSAASSRAGLTSPAAFSQHALPVPGTHPHAQAAAQQGLPDGDTDGHGSGSSGASSASAAAAVAAAAAAAAAASNGGATLSKGGFKDVADMEKKLLTRVRKRMNRAAQTGADPTAGVGGVGAGAGVGGAVAAAVAVGLAAYLTDDERSALETLEAQRLKLLQKSQERVLVAEELLLMIEREKQALAEKVQGFERAIYGAVGAEARAEGVPLPLGATRRAASTAVVPGGGQGIAAVGEEVAVRDRSDATGDEDDDEEAVWILAHVIEHIPEESVYLVQDVDTSSAGREANDSESMEVPEHMVVRLRIQEAYEREPVSNLPPPPKLTKGEEVYALYEETTAFYPATVHQLPRKSTATAEGFLTCQVMFRDDADALTGVTLPKSVLLRHVFRPVG